MHTNEFKLFRAPMHTAYENIFKLYQLLFIFYFVLTFKIQNFFTTLQYLTSRFHWIINPVTGMVYYFYQILLSINYILFTVQKCKIQLLLLLDWHMIWFICRLTLTLYVLRELRVATFYLLCWTNTQHGVEQRRIFIRDLIMSRSDKYIFGTVAHLDCCVTF